MLWIGVITPLLMLVDFYVLDDKEMKMTMEDWPSRLVIIKQIIFFMLVEDSVFYWSHRLLHHPRVYPYIHKRHHEYKDTVSIASEYAHPLESILSNTLPTVAGFKLLGG
jgi:sterol desaturase/sphingolipid hydroxylase (fatty acid hydroxylase superfamily)